jgi:hypothetical protein
MLKQMQRNRNEYVYKNQGIAKLDPTESDYNYNLHVQFNKNLRRYDDELDIFEEAYYDKKRNLQAEFENIVHELKLVEEKHSALKLNIQEFTRQQRYYYFEILRKGIDVRSEGLSWVVKKLIELNAFFDNSHFPKFLDRNEIEYLLDISYKDVDIMYLSLILKALKKKQKIRRSVLGDEVFNLATEKHDELKGLHVFQKKKFCEKMIKIYNNISGKTEHDYFGNNKLEDINIDSLLNDLISKIKSPHFLENDVIKINLV